METVDYASIREMLQKYGLQVLQDEARRKGFLQDIFPEEDKKADIICRILSGTDVEIIKNVCANEDKNIISSLSQQWRNEFWIGDEAIEFVWNFFGEIFANGKKIGAEGGVVNNSDEVSTVEHQIPPIHTVTNERKGVQNVENDRRPRHMNLIIGGFLWFFWHL